MDIFGFSDGLTCDFAVGSTFSVDHFTSGVVGCLSTNLNDFNS